MIVGVSIICSLLRLIVKAHLKEVRSFERWLDCSQKDICPLLAAASVLSVLPELHLQMGQPLTHAMDRQAAILASDQAIGQIVADRYGTEVPQCRHSRRRDPVVARSQQMPISQGPNWPFMRSVQLWIASTAATP
jgi:hypothetical protein